jgi:hypothetical protein
VVVAVALTLALTSCSEPSPDPADPLPDGSNLPSETASSDPDPVAESPYPPCDDATAAALHDLYPGETLDEPTGDYYPGFLPLPSCVFEDTDFAIATAVFIPATETDFEALESAIAAEQGAGTPSDGQGLATAGELWDGQPVQGIYLLPADFGVPQTYIALRLDFP